MILFMIDKYKHIYFIGIGGIGMSALAMYFYKTGYDVAGYDLVKNINCEKLEKSGIKVHYSDDLNKIEKCFFDKLNTLIIYTPAIPETHKELSYFKKNGFKILKRAEALGIISKSKKSMTVAGTHGKTSVSSLCAWIMEHSQQKCTAFLGGVSKNFDSNIIINRNSEFMVIEADEFDRSFLNLNPYISLITSIEKDHLDIYKNYDNLYNSFVDFLNLTNENGHIILNCNINRNILKKIKTTAKIHWYSLNNSDSDFYIDNLKYTEDKSHFDFIYSGGKIENLVAQTGGKHNLENIAAAIAMCVLNGVNSRDIKTAINSYIGVKRRFDIKIKNADRIFIDDYAHHPREISATIDAVKEIFPGKKICGIFQPHLYSRTRDFAKEFAEELSKLDSLFLLPIYPAREEPIKGVSSKIIYDLCTCKKTKLCKKNEIFELIEKENPDLLLTMGAGDIDNLIKPLCQILNKHEK